MTRLQNIIFPETSVCDENDLYFRASNLVSVNPTSSALQIRQNDSVTFNTYFNALSIAKWHKECRLDGLYLSLRTVGELVVEVLHSDPDGVVTQLAKNNIQSKALKTTQINLSSYETLPALGVIYFKITAINQVTIHEAGFDTDTSPNPDTTLAICITTFQREVQVQNTVKRLDQFLNRYRYNNKLHVFIVDNGRSANIKNTTHITSIHNPNLGGSGGFARGLKESKTAGFSHCLFMDDDAVLHMENITRAYAFLALAENSKSAIAGAMISNRCKWAMWENGAYFDRTCHQLHCGVDLRDFTAVQTIEAQSQKPPSNGYYGGWWFFAFPIAQAKHYPFPFFVRGDDINFSLVNNFHISTLNGVVCFQDAFCEKESPHTLYLDLRNNILQHLTLKKMDIGALACTRIGLWFVLRTLARYHYETAEALLLSWNDVMRGPQFFSDNADMKKRRKTINALIHREVWVGKDRLNPQLRQGIIPHHNIPLGRFFKLTLNGHILPFYKLYANHIEVPPSQRSALHPIWGASRLTYYTPSRKEGYTVQHSKVRFALLIYKTFIATVRFLFLYPKLKKQYRATHRHMTSKAFWDKKFTGE